MKCLFCGKEAEDDNLVCNECAKYLDEESIEELRMAKSLYDINIKDEKILKMNNIVGVLSIVIVFLSTICFLFLPIFNISTKGNINLLNESLFKGNYLTGISFIDMIKNALYMESNNIEDTYIRYDLTFFFLYKKSISKPKPVRIMTTIKT